MKYRLVIVLFALFSFSCSKEIIQQKLSVSINPVNGGTVSPPSNSYEKGQTIQLLATPSSEYVFKEWKGDLTGNVNPSSLTMNTDKSISGNFEKRQYPLNLTIEGSGSIKEEIISVATQSQYPSGTTVRLTPQPLEGWAFSSWSGDLSSTSNPLDLKVDKVINLKAIFEKKIITKISLINPIDTLSISQIYTPQVVGLFADGTFIDVSKSIVINPKSKNVSIINKNKLTVSNAGLAEIEIVYDKYSTPHNFIAKTFYYNDIPSELKSDKNCKNEVNVAIVRVLATKDGINLDESKGPDSPWAYNNPTLDIQKQKFNDDNIITKNSIEYGTRFRDYGSGKEKKYVCINTVAYVDVFDYKLIPYNINSEAQKTLDFNELFQRINMKSLVNNKKVKEVWMNILYKGNMNSVRDNKDDDRNTFWNIQESNMSSPSPSGDISNSNRDNNDLPIYNSTYVVYAHYGTAGVETNLHVRGHQIEAQLYYLDKTPLTVGSRKKLFSDLFVGSGNGTNNMPLGRVGMTHFPPNTTRDYDYDNKNLVNSDIKNWIPSDLGGEKTPINSDTWNKINYPFNTSARFACLKYQQCVLNYKDYPQFMWLLYWFQSIPGENNKIPFEFQNKKYELENWWDLFYNWDDAIKNKKTLWIE